MNFVKNKSGFSLIEISLVIGIFAIFSIGIAYLSIDTIERTSKVVSSNEALHYAQEGLEATRNIRDKDYLSLTNGDHGLSFENNSWNFGLAPEKIDNFYDRYITISDVYRNTDGNIDSNGTIYDPDTKRINSKINWLQNGIIPKSITLKSYLSNWKGDDWIRTTCMEFENGTFENTEVIGLNPPPDNNCGIILQDIENENTFFSSSDVGKHGNNVDVDSNYAYLATNDQNKGLNIINITNKETPVITKSINLGAEGTAVKKDDNYLYMGIDKTNGISIIDVSNPSNPSTLSNINSDGSPNQLDIQGNYLYAAINNENNAFKIYDITSKSAPLLKKTLDLDDALHAIKINGNYAYLGSFKDTNAFIIIDISNPLNASQISSLSVGEEVNTIAISGNIAFLGTENTDDSLKIVDISNPANPILLTSLNTNGEIQALTISGDYLYAAIDKTQSGLAAINISNPTNPHLAYNLDIGGKGTGITSDENYIYVSTDTANKGLVIIGTTITGTITTGTYISDTLDTGSSNTTYNFIEWDNQSVPGGSIKFQIRTASTSEDLSSATWIGPNGTDSTYYETSRTQIVLPNNNNNQYFQYKLFMTSDGVSSPVINSIRINYTP